LWGALAKLLLLTDFINTVRLFQTIRLITAQNTSLDPARSRYSPSWSCDRSSAIRVLAPRFPRFWPCSNLVGDASTILRRLTCTRIEGSRRFKDWLLERSGFELPRPVIRSRPVVQASVRPFPPFRQGQVRKTPKSREPKSRATLRFARSSLHTIDGRVEATGF
jgi:hypothetical protein